MKRIYLVTGATGHLGLTICNELIERGEKVRVFVLKGARNDSHLPSVEIFYGDVTDYESLVKAFTVDIDEELYVIHCAGIVTISSSISKKLRDVNVNGTTNVIRACKEKHVAKMVYVSSVHAIEEIKSGVVTETAQFDPKKVKGAYAKTKAEATRKVLKEAKNGYPFVVVHPSGIIGPNDFGGGHLTQLIIDFCNGSLKACVCGGYDFVDVRDVSAGILAAADANGGECFILSGHYATIKELLDILRQITGKKAVRTVLPKWFVQIIAPMAELHYKIRKQPPLFTSYSMYTLSSNAKFSCQKAKEQLNYTSRPLYETLFDTVLWLAENNRLKK